MPLKKRTGETVGKTTEEKVRADTVRKSSRTGLSKGGRKLPKEPASTIERAQILNKYWELANLHPEVTKGNITGQLKALDSLLEEVAPAPGETKSEAVAAKRGVYRSAWMHKAGGTQEEG